MKKRSGLTALEILVLLLIVGILTAILYPVFMRAKQKADEQSMPATTPAASAPVTPGS